MPRSVVAAVLERAGSHPDAVAVVEADREIGYATLAADVEAAANGLQAQGVAAGDTVALDQDGGAEGGYAVACRLYGLLYLGASVLPLGSELLPERRERLLREFGARRLGAQAPAYAPARRADDPGRPSVYRFSAGSTGEPKAAVVSNEKWAAMYVAQARALRLGSQDRVLPALPLPATMGLRSMVRAHAVGGAVVNLPFPRDLASLAQAVERHGITHAAASPAQLRFLLAQPAPAGLRMPPLRGVITGGAPLLPAEQAAVHARISPNLYIDYGAVDFSMIAVQAPGDGLRLLEGIEAQVVDAAGRAQPEGAEGILRVRAAWAPTEHAGGAASPHFRDGWFYPGDIAALLPGRGLRLLGRADDLINRSGIKIVPEEIEAVLRAHPDVLDVAVAGVPDALSGEVPIAFVVLRRLEALPELDAWCRGRVEAIRFPAKFVALSVIPRSAEGKVLRAQLRALARGR